MGKIEIAWTPLPLSWIKINTDGASNSSTLNAACGGLLQNMEGRWIQGYAKHLGFYSLFNMGHGILKSLVGMWFESFDLSFGKAHEFTQLFNSSCQVVVSSLIEDRSASFI